MIDPLLPHLIDIVSDPAAEGLILAGGFGIRLKQTYLQEIEARTLIPTVPTARATVDLDFFLQMSLFVQIERGKAVRALLDRLNYSEYEPKWQFGKPFAAVVPDHKVKVDLLARSPREDEGVRVKAPRVGSGARIDLHGFETPEAFAVEEMPVSLSVRGLNSDGIDVKTSVTVPHVYAWLNMKVKAAHDWLRADRDEIEKKPARIKHVFDVYILTAMLMENELEEGRGLALRYDTHPIAREVRDCARDLYGNEESPGVQEVRRQSGMAIDYPVFWEGLRGVLGITR